LRNAGAVERRARADWKSFRKRAIKSGVFSDGTNTPLQAIYQCKELS